MAIFFPQKRRRFLFLLVFNFLLLVLLAFLFGRLPIELPLSEKKPPSPPKKLVWNNQRIEEKITLETKEDIQMFAKDGASFQLDIGNLTFRDVGSGVWYFYNDKGEAIFRIPKPSAVDAEGEFTNDVSVEVLKKQSGETIARLTVNDKDWLINPERVLPVTFKLVLEIVPEKR